MTLKEFMKTYDGFDWKNGKVVLVNKRGKPIICEGAWKFYIDKHENEMIWSWTHSNDLMVISLMPIWQGEGGKRNVDND